MEWINVPVVQHDNALDGIVPIEPLDGMCIVYVCWDRYHDSAPGACGIRFCFTRSCLIN